MPGVPGIAEYRDVADSEYGVMPGYSVEAVWTEGLQ